MRDVQNSTRMPGAPGAQILTRRAPMNSEAPRCALAFRGAPCKNSGAPGRKLIFSNCYFNIFKSVIGPVNAALYFELSALCENFGTHTKII